MIETVLTHQLDLGQGHDEARDDVEGAHHPHHEGLGGDSPAQRWMHHHYAAVQGKNENE